MAISKKKIATSFQKWKGWLYLLPALAILSVFTFWPIFNTIFMAFSEGYSALEHAAGATFPFGIGNFVKVIGYKNFLNCLQNTCLLCVITVPVSTLLALLISVALNSIKFLLFISPLPVKFANSQAC